MPLGAREKEELFEAAFKEYSSECYAWKWSDVPETKWRAAAGMVGDPIAAQDFPCRPAANVKTMFNVIDLILNHAGPIDEKALDVLIKDAEERKESWWARPDVPEVLRPGAELPVGSKIQVVIERSSDNSVNIVKHFALTKAM